MRRRRTKLLASVQLALLELDGGPLIASGWIYLRPATVRRMQLTHELEVEPICTRGAAGGGNCESAQGPIALVNRDGVVSSTAARGTIGRPLLAVQHVT